MKIATEQQASALCRLGHDSDGKELIAWLRASLEENDVTARITRDEITVRQLQGSSQAIQRILEALEVSAAALDDAARRGLKTGTPHNAAP